ncbi:hypothetical protein HELRODRAFT_171136 [Helobdella robusta]|uniref:Uncharacterized protein n=1 Tax=Helobdella robusta TaxID=6412 RepID=T1F3U4_HELRO|nr:hypothetical protein HELRODRAFT_171136 [Helobdella robusta]ESO05499.1 hypothetical protein HELRODRAFT_171136 [Helobdella robusta]
MERLRNNTESLSNVFDSIKKNVLDKEKLINEKEEVLTDLRKVNQNLKKSAEILDSRIQELEKNLEGKQSETKKTELTKLREKICNLEDMNTKISDREKVDLSKKKKVKRELQMTKQSFKMLNNDIYECTGLIHRTNELRSKVAAMVEATFHLNKEVVEQDQMDIDSLCDFNAQRSHLKMTVTKTKKEMKGQMLMQEKKELNNMQKNGRHMDEIESLKLGLKKSKEQLKSLYSQFFNRRPDISSKQLQEMMVKAIPDFRMLGQVAELARTIELNSQLINDLQIENCYLKAGAEEEAYDQLYNSNRNIVESRSKKLNSQDDRSFKNREHCFLISFVERTKKTKIVLSVNVKQIK